jgi:PleD family two-component response regulator
MADNPLRQETEVPARCLACPAFRRVLVVRETAGTETELDQNLRAIGFQVQAMGDWKQVCAEVNEFDCEFMIWDTHLPLPEEMPGSSRVGSQQEPVAKEPAGAADRKL